MLYTSKPRRSAGAARCDFLQHLTLGVTSELDLYTMAARVYLCNPCGEDLHLRSELSIHAGGLTWPYH